MLIEILPKYSAAQVSGYIKGKSAIHIARTYMGKKQNFTGENFRAKGYYVSTEGRDEESIKKYIRGQEVENQQGQPPLGGFQINRFERFTKTSRRFTGRI
jgi:putative transposase